MGKPSKASALEVQVVPIGALALDQRNARKHGRRNLDAIKASLSQFGQRRPLVVMHDMTVIAGNGTLMAAVDLGWREVAITIVPADWTADQAKAYALADNRTAELAEWDDAALADMLAELDAGGWDLNSIGFDGLPELAPGDADDNVPDDDAAAKTAPGDVWALGEHRVACGSSTDSGIVETLFGGQLANLVLTDPPYGVDYVANKDRTASAVRGQRVGKHKSIAGDALSSDGLVELLKDALGLSWGSAREGAGCYIFHSEARRVEFEGAMRACDWHVAQNLVWIKDNFVFGRMDYHSQHEPVLYGWKPGGRHAWYGGRKHASIVADQQPDFDAMDRGELLTLLQGIYEYSDVIRHDRPRRSDEHPTMKPVGLLSRLIVNSTKKGGLVYDPFLGSGSTLIAAERQGRTCYGIELDPHYCDVIVRRWETVTGRQAALAT